MTTAHSPWALCWICGHEILAGDDVALAASGDYVHPDCLDDGPEDDSRLNPDGDS